MTMLEWMRLVRHVEGVSDLVMAIPGPQSASQMDASLKDALATWLRLFPDSPLKDVPIS